jgi:alcohol dehydrogenase class IV
VIARPFTLALPTRLVFGTGVAATVGREAVAFGGRVALVTGTSFAANPGAAGIEGFLSEAGATIVARIASAGEPHDDAVRVAASQLAAAEPDVIVAVGGGSVLDLAKAAAAVADDPDRLSALLAGERLEAPGRLPVIALPTTAGSGAEMSHAAIVLDRGAARKRGIRGPGVAARVALVDPELTRGAGADITASAGFDAIAHALETAASRAAGPLNLALSAEALRRLLVHLPRACATPDDLAARTECAYAAALMGINLATSTTCLPHRLQYPLGALTGTGHASGVAALFPAWLARTVEAAPDALARLAIAAGVAAPGSADDAAARTLAARIGDHLRATGMWRGIGDLGVGESDIPDLVAAVEGTLTNDPGPVGPDDLAALYRASLVAA